MAFSPRARLARVFVVLAFLPLPALAALPIISGTPSAQAAVGQRYTFVPTASDADGDRLIFWIQSKPSWATFDWRTGGITGIPAATDVGVKRNIVIGVGDVAGDRSRVQWLPPFDITVSLAGGTNRPPVISGTPPTSVVVGQQYSFQPVASDPDGDTVRFWVASKPSWATFDKFTGRLYGTPGSADQGVYPNIVIAANDGAVNARLPKFSISVVPASSGSATLSWFPPTRRTDGSPLTNLAAYRIRWGTAPGSFPNNVRVDNPGLSSYVVSNLAPGTYFFVVTAIDSAGLESGYSNQAQKTIQ
jgi:putative Ig domain-containing protein